MFRKEFIYEDMVKQDISEYVKQCNSCGYWYCNEHFIEDHDSEKCLRLH